MENKNKMTLIKQPTPDLDKFLGVEEEKKAKPWRVILDFSKDDEDVIRAAFEKSTYKAMYQFLKDAILTNKDLIR